MPASSAPSADAGPSKLKPTAKPFKPQPAASADADESQGGEGAVGGGAGAASDDSDDEVADFRMLLPQLIAAKKNEKGGAASSTAGGGSLPKRGEKDFEPTGFRGQEKKLEESRRAMEMVIGQERRIGSKSLSTAVWHPELKRAVVHLAKGNTMGAMGVTTRAPVTAKSQDELPLGTQDVIGPDNQVGVWKAGIFYPRYSSSLELLPEETLYLLERGSLECTVPMPLRDDPTEVVEVPLSLQHAFSLMIGKDGLTRERYQTYAYLKRLGYYVQRAEITEGLRAAAAAARRKQRLADAACDEGDGAIATPGDAVKGKGIVADPKRPLRLVSLWDLMTYIPRRAAQILATALVWLKRQAARAINALWTARRRGANSTSTMGSGGRGLLGIGGAKWDSFDTVYSRLQIIPSGHGSAAAAKAKTTTTSPSTSSSSSSSSCSPFDTFFYAWRPATHFRKTDPPLPEFRISVISARSTCLPKLAEFRNMFDSVPLPLDEVAAAAKAGGGGEDGDGMGSGNEEEAKEERKRAMEEKKRNDESYGRGFVMKRKKEEAAAARLKKSGAKGAEEGQQAGKASWLQQLRRTILSRLLIVLHRLSSLFAHLPPGCGPLPSTFVPRHQQQQQQQRWSQSGPRRPNPFPPLKAGRRNVIVAVVDHGTTSLLRFGEAEFSRWKLMG